MKSHPCKGEVLAAQLGADALGDLLGASFNGYGWALASPSNETSRQLIGLKLAAVKREQLVLNILGLKVRSVVVRRVRSSRHIDSCA